MSLHLAVDIGGTFTDLYLIDETGTSASFKTPTTPSDLTKGLLNAFEAAASSHDTSLDQLLAETDRFIHGTTVATNAIIENNVADTALLCTDGFRDILTLREGGKQNPYDWDVEYPDPYVPRSLTFGIDERIDAEGNVVTELNETDVRTAIDRILDRDIDAVAVSLLWAHVNPIHEKQIGDIIDEIAPDLDYSLSHEVAPIIREYRRTSATAINASLYGLVESYLSNLDNQLTSQGFDENVLMITANGGVLETEEVSQTPIWLVDSGPTMLPVAVRELAQTELNRDNVIALDMGGTSLDMSVVKEGTISRSRDASVGEQDYTIGIEKVDVRAIASGGGSIAWVDSGGLLHVGPQSAGAEPGPVCYGRGGQEPTVTDAALVLGYLNEDYFAGGEISISADDAVTAIDDKIGSRLGMDAVDAADTVYATATQNMVNGIQEVTIEQGVDPRKYVLSGGGGALGLHIVPIAREFGIDDILLPRKAGVISSIGGVASDVRRDFSESLFTTGESFDHRAVNDMFESLDDRARGFFERANVSEGDRALTRYVEARYPDQIWELEFQVPFERISQGDQQRLMELFHQTHEEVYGFSIDEQDVHFLHWRVEAAGENDTAVYSDTSVGSEDTLTYHDEREAYFDGRMQRCPAYRAVDFSAGDELDGPAFIDAETTTIVLPPESDLQVTEYGNYRIQP